MVIVSMGLQEEQNGQTAICKWVWMSNASGLTGEAHLLFF